jgi:hypothetical protein
MSFPEVDGRRYVANIVEIPPYMGFTLEELKKLLRGSRR